MKKLQVNVPDEQLARMDEYLRGLGKPFYTRSDLVRDLIFERLKGSGVVRPVEQPVPEVPAP